MSRIKRFLVGNPLSTEMMVHERIPKWKALAVLSSDALSSVAYATEEVLIPLAAFGAAAVSWSIPIALAIAALLVIVTISYRQTIDAYPNGGGAYTVAKENLGAQAGLVAAASLLIDYILTVAVSVAAGVENITSAFPSLVAHKEALGVSVILLIMVLNLRGLKESASIFAIPTYLFIFSFVILILVACWNLYSGVALPVAPLIHETYPAIPLFLLLRAFSSGCAALTGIEAISNGVPVFREPGQKNAKTTMFWMSFTLGSLFLAITLLAHLYGIVPQDGETAVSLLARAVMGQSFFYYVVQASTALILFLAANTSYADFPRLSSLLAKDRYLPRQLASLGDRLVFSNGIIGLSIAAILLIIAFKGDTHLLIPLYAVGVFLSFTLSQLGMVVHHIKLKEEGWIKGLAFNLLGSVTTLIVLLVIGATKFLHGAWMVVVFIPILVFIFNRIHKHYVWIANQLSFQSSNIPIKIEIKKNITIIPVSGLHVGVINALQYAALISSDVRACYVLMEEDATIRLKETRLKEAWSKLPQNFPLMILPSKYRSVMTPIIEYIDLVKKESSDALITVVIPEFVTPKWYHNFLHNQTALQLRALLHFKRGIVVTSVRYHL